MATQQSISQSVSQSKSAVVVPFPSPREVNDVTQLEVAALLSLRNRARQLAKQIETAEFVILERLEAGAAVEPGEHTAELKQTFRRNVAWKDVVVRLAARLKMDGAAYCAKVLSSTKPTRTVSLILN